jgi:transcriptional regulator with XRE-family HTH domain
MSCTGLISKRKSRGRSACASPRECTETSPRVLRRWHNSWRRTPGTSRSFGLSPLSSSPATTLPVALPFCNITLRTAKPLPRTYPREPKTLGEHLKKRMIDLGVSRKGCAKQLGVSPATVTNWRTDTVSPAPQFIPRIIGFLGYNPFHVDGESLGERIVILRKTLGMTTQDLARRLGVDPGTVARWEKGNSLPSEKHVDLLDSLLPLPLVDPASSLRSILLQESLPVGGKE